jgi:hypothetical protein
VFAPRPVLEEPIARAARDLVHLALGVADGDAALRAVRSEFTAGTRAAEGDRLAEVAEADGAAATPEDLATTARSLGFKGTAALLRTLVPEGTEGNTAAPPDALWDRALRALETPGRLLPSYETAAADADSLPRHAAEASALAAVHRLLEEVALGFRGLAVVTPAEFAAAFDGALARGTFQPPDRRLHAVNAVDAEEARQWEARGVLLAGLQEKEFPRAPREDLFLRDRDRRAANDRATEGDGAPRLRFSERLRGREEERLLFYAACTRARERLVLSYATAGEDGARLLRSSFLDEVLRLWPADEQPVSSTHPADPAPVDGEALARRDLLRGALVRVAAPFVHGGESELRALRGAATLDALAATARGGRDEAIASAAARAVDLPGRLQRPRATARFLRPLVTSASGLAVFHQCAYKHFAARLLKLSPPQRADDEGLDARAVGTIVHSVLERWFQGEGAGDAGALFDEELAKHPGGVRGLDDRNRARRARAAVIQCVLDESARVKERSFRPVGFEVPFGMSHGDAPALVLRVGRRRVEVRGLMDRVDVDPRGRAIAVDYKVSFSKDGRSYQEKDHGSALEGADPQVPLYWMALRHCLGKEPAGVEIVDVVHDRVTGLRGADAEDSVAPDSRSMILPPDGDAAVEAAMLALAKRVVDSLVEGRVEPSPADFARCGSGNCEYADLCRFDGVEIP